MRLPYTTAPETELFGDSPMSREERTLTLRTWSELAFWFSALSRGTAVTPVGANKAANCDMTSVGGGIEFSTDIVNGYISHTYMTSKPTWTTRSLYESIAEELRGVERCQK